jgi:hypothetical protein
VTVSPGRAVEVFGETEIVKVPTDVGDGDGLAVGGIVAVVVIRVAGAVVTTGVTVGGGTAGPVVGDVTMARTAMISAPATKMMRTGITRVFTVDIVSSSVLSLSLIVLF